jgi:hypothetical protein
VGSVLTFSGNDIGNRVQQLLLIPDAPLVDILTFFKHYADDFPFVQWHGRILLKKSRIDETVDQLQWTT